MCAKRPREGGSNSTGGRSRTIGDRGHIRVGVARQHPIPFTDVDVFRTITTTVEQVMSEP